MKEKDNKIVKRDNILKETFLSLLEEIEDSFFLFKETPFWFSSITNKFSNLKEKHPKFRFLDKKDQYIIYGEIPGFSKENLDISINDNYINISGEISSKVEGGKEDNTETYYNEYSSFKEKFYLPEDADITDINKIKAVLKNGILKIIIPKREEQSQKIEITQEE